LVHI